MLRAGTRRRKGEASRTAAQPSSGGSTSGGSHPKPQAVGDLGDTQFNVTLQEAKKGDS